MNSINGEKLPITVVILTKNEEEVIVNAIKSAEHHFSEIIVLDSFSDDSTVELALLNSAKVFQNTFFGYASQRNFALKEMSKVNEWVLFLDADEVISEELVHELHQVFKRLVTEGFGMAYLRRKDFFMGQWIRRSSGYPTWFGRLCHAPSVRVEREINEEYHCDLQTMRLSGHLLHYPFAKGLAYWIDRHNRYSTAEAKEKVNSPRIEPRLIFTRDPGLRRKGLKQLYMLLPFRPLVGFLYLYVLNGGFLDGKAGLRFAILRAFYEFLIDLKLDEIRVSSKVREHNR